MTTVPHSQSSNPKPFKQVEAFFRPTLYKQKNFKKFLLLLDHFAVLLHLNKLFHYAT